MKISVELKGLKALTQKLDARVRRLEQSILRKALQAFAEPIRANAEQLARTLISSRMKVVTAISIRGSSGTVRIGPSTEAFRITDSGRTVSHAMIGYWFEFGYDLRSKKPRHIGSRPSLTPAYESQKDRGLAAFEQVMRDNLETELAA